MNHSFVGNAVRDLYTEKNLRYSSFIIGLILCFLCADALSEENKYERRTYVTTRIDSLEPVIDGRLDDPLIMNIILMRTGMG